MRIRVSGRNGRLLSRAFIGVVLLAGVSTAATAQTTVTLSQPSQVVFATIRGGSFANDNEPSVLVTRSATNPEYKRRALLKFDTQNDIPVGSSVTSALLTMTVKTGSEDASRNVGAYQVTTSWAQDEVTWNRRRTGTTWGSNGGDLGSRLDTSNVSNVKGSRVTFDVTALVKLAVAGKLGTSRYTRIALVDLDGSTSASWREYYTSKDTNAAVRPVLKITYGGSTSTPTSAPTTSTTSTTLRVLHWNTHHGGVGTDGVWDADRLIKKAASFRPDVVSFNEVQHYDVNQPALFASLMKKYTGRTCYYKFASGTGTTSGIGNLIMSRFPFDATEVRPLSYSRAIIDATIHVNGRPVNLMTTHLDAESTSARLKEIGELTSWARGIAERRIICGDFNAWPGSTENSTMKNAYYDSWAEAQADGTAVAYAGNTAGNTRNSRIDYIYFSHGTSGLVLKSSQVFDTRDANGVMPSDHRPVMTIFTVK